MELVYVEFSDLTQISILMLVKSMPPLSSSSDFRIRIRIRIPNTFLIPEGKLGFALFFNVLHGAFKSNPPRIQEAPLKIVALIYQ